MRKRFQLTLTIDDFKLLMKYYFTKGLSVFNKRKLFVELNDAHIVSEGLMPLNIARQGSRVLVRNIGKNQTYGVHMIPQNAVPGKSSNILMSDPLSIALLGYAHGHRTEWEMPDGVQQFELISVRRDMEEPAYLMAGNPDLYEGEALFV